ncbi:MAG: DUF2141 domain-containing protein [Pseudomonadota bacterium]|nr:DUF2141 domain-containing protein [Pseudomonadota bacterium]
MKINICSFIFFLLFFNNLKSAELTIKILNVAENIGLIHFAIYDSAEFFPENEGKKIGFKKKVIDLVDHEVTLSDLEESYYAVAIYHDKNSNGKFDTFLSIPQEKFGFSNDAKVFFGPPNFDEASFYLKKNQRLKIEISLR